MYINTDNKQNISLIAISTIFMASMLSLGIISLPNIEAQFQPQDTNQTDRKQVFIEKNNLKSYESINTFKINYPNYNNIYNVTYLFDNLINSYSYFSVRGTDTGFNTILNTPLDKKICSAEFSVFNPTLKTPFKLTLSNSSGSAIQTGLLDSSLKDIKFVDCINNVNKISATFTPTNIKEYTILSELKLYTDKNIIDPPPLECPDGYEIKDNKCVPIVTPPPSGNQTITNSTITIDISNSDINILANHSNIHFPNMTMPYPNMTIPELTHDINDTSDEEEEEEEREEQEKDNNDNEDDDE